MNIYNLVFITVAVFLAVSFGATTPAPTTASPTTALPTTSSVGKVCKYNYQCSGNTICDGTACTGGLGLVLDSSSNTLAYGSTCEYSTGSRYTLRTVSASGGVPNVFSVVFANDNVRRVVAYRDGDIYFDELRPDGTHALFRAGQTLLGLTVVTQEPTTPYNFQGFQEIAPSGVIYDCVSDNSGNFFIIQFPTALNLESVPVPIVVYSLGSYRCGPVRVGVNNGLLYVSYFVGDQTLIFQGSTGCVNCAIPTIPFLSIAAMVNDFDVSTNYLFYGTGAGLFRSNITSTSAPVKITSEDILGVSAGASPLVYFTNSLGGVFSTPVNVNPSYPANTNVAQPISSTCEVESS